ncbi:Hypothetical predicted protein [Paramuricea clavata]|uniref:Uncharacterized protein n=1 Tax=Paramuricea clavata TaxID=317549 RepID=A0A6S7IW00_PARCT|nr:Hypothetical predicted protein [Paramuricea clavata]
MSVYNGILLNLIVGFLTIQPNPVTFNGKNTTSKPNIAESGLSKGIIAVILSLGLTTFFVVVIAYLMVRGYKHQRNADLPPTEIPATEETPSDHTAAQSNLGLSKL